MTAQQKSFDVKAKREEELMIIYTEWKNSFQGTNYTLDFQEDKYSPFDVIVKEGGVPKYTVEIKVRENYSFESIERMGGSFLEAKKIKGIIDRQVEMGLDLPILYINFYSDQVITYKLPKTSASYKWEHSRLQANDYSKQAIEKRVTKLQRDMIVEIKNRKK